MEVLASCAHTSRTGSKKGTRGDGASSSASGVIDPADVDVDAITEDSVRAQDIGEAVPVSLYNQLQEEVLYLQSLVREKEALITEKDAAVEV